VDATEHTNVTSLEQLSEGELKHHHGETQEEESEQVGDEEDATSPLVSKVRETPEVSKTNSGTDSGQDEGSTSCPALSRSSNHFVFVSEEIYES